MKIELKNYRVQDQSREMFLLLTTSKSETDVQELSQSLVTEAGGVSTLGDSVASLRNKMCVRAGGPSARSDDLTALAVTL